MLEIVEELKRQNNIPDEEVIGFFSEMDANAYTFSNPNTTQVGMLYLVFIVTRKSSNNWGVV